MKRLYRYMDAVRLFIEVKAYNNKWERFVCRYHLYKAENDYSLILKIRGDVHDKKDYLNLLQTCRDDMEWVFQNGLFDVREHYDSCRLLLAKLESYTKHYPLLWYVVFKIKP